MWIVTTPLVQIYEYTLLTVYKVVQFGQCLQTIHLSGQTVLGADNFALVYLCSLATNTQVVRERKSLISYVICLTPTLRKSWRARVEWWENWWLVEVM